MKLTPEYQKKWDEIAKRLEDDEFRIRTEREFYLQVLNTFLSEVIIPEAFEAGRKSIVYFGKGIHPDLKIIIKTIIQTDD